MGHSTNDFKLTRNVALNSNNRLCNTGGGVILLYLDVNIPYGNGTYVTFFLSSKNETNGQNKSCKRVKGCSLLSSSPAIPTFSAAVSSS